MNKQIQHVVTLSTDLQSNLDPIQIGTLEEFGALKALEKGSLGLGLGWFGMQLVGHPRLEFLIGHSHFGWVIHITRYSITEPVID